VGCWPGAQSKWAPLSCPPPSKGRTPSLQDRGSSRREGEREQHQQGQQHQCPKCTVGREDRDATALCCNLERPVPARILYISLSQPPSLLSNDTSDKSGSDRGSAGRGAQGKQRLRFWARRIRVLGKPVSSLGGVQGACWQPRSTGTWGGGRGGAGRARFKGRCTGGGADPCGEWGGMVMGGGWGWGWGGWVCRWEVPGGGCCS